MNDEPDSCHVMLSENTQQEEATFNEALGILLSSLKTIKEGVFLFFLGTQAELFFSFSLNEGNSQNNLPSTKNHPATPERRHRSSQNG